MSQLVEREHTIGLFDELVARGAGTVQVVSGEDPQLVVIGPPDLADRVVVRYRHMRLVVSCRTGPNPLQLIESMAQQVRIIVVTDALSRVVAQGAANIRLGEDAGHPLTTDSLKIIHSGHGVVSGYLSASSVVVALRGIGRMDLAGDTDTLNVRMSGIGSLDALELVAKRARVGVNGVGSASVLVLDELRATVSGTGRLRYRGSARLTTAAGSRGRVEHLQ